MAEKRLSCFQVSIPHKDMVVLRNAGRLRLGIDNNLASRITSSGRASKKTTASAAYHFWTYIGLGIFIYTIYLSVTKEWWWFFIGFLTMGAIANSNLKANSSNLMDAAIIDEDFYEQVRQFGGWVYMIEEEDAAKYSLR